MICLELGEVNAAKQWLSAGQCLVETLDSDYNQGGVEELRARLLWTRAWRERHEGHGLEPQTIREIVTIYGMARELIFVSGFDVASLDAEVKMVRQGEAPPWSRVGWRRAELDDTVSGGPAVARRKIE